MYNAVGETLVGALYLFPSGYIVPVSVAIGTIEAEGKSSSVVRPLSFCSEVHSRRFEMFGGNDRGVSALPVPSGCLPPLERWNVLVCSFVD